MSVISMSGIPFKDAYQMPLFKYKVGKNHIYVMLNENIIRKSNSTYSSPVLLVPKCMKQFGVAYILGISS